MITDKKKLKEYLEADRVALGMNSKRPPLLGQEVWKYERALRYVEYYQNCNQGGIMRIYWKWQFHRLGVKLGFHISPNCCGKGLKISHSGCVVINRNANIGDYCTIQQCVNIGRNHKEDDVPTIGDYVYLGPGAKIFGKIIIADRCAVGAGAIVTKSFLNPGMNIVGNPAHEQGERREGLN